MLGLSSNTRVFIKTGFIDGRLAYHGLRALVIKVLKEEPRDGALFVFCNRRANLAKFLWYHEGGYYIACKRMDRGSIDWPRSDKGAQSMSTAQLHSLLKGVEFRRSAEPRPQYRR